jgi:hypothetical protein
MFMMIFLRILPAQPVPITAPSALAAWVSAHSRPGDARFYTVAV